MIVFDTTVLVYALGAEHPAREPCRRLLAAAGQGRLSATTTVEVVQEFVHVYGRRRKRSDAARYGREYATLLGPLLAPGAAELEAGLELYERHPELGAFDAVLAAAALASRSRALVSADGAFASVPELAHVDPTAPELEALLT